MRIIIQKVKQASVSVDDKTISNIGVGLLVFVGLHEQDQQKDTDYIIKKILSLKIFGDEKTFMKDNVVDIGGEILLISQFTLYADCKKGTKPSFSHAMSGPKAKEFYANFVDQFKQKYEKVKNGVFGAYMDVSLINDGPLTIIIDS